MVRTKVVWPRDDGNAVVAFKETAAMGRVDGSSCRLVWDVSLCVVRGGC